MTAQLPSNPNLQQLRNQAKELLKRRKEADPEATVGLQECQHALAQDYGCKSWAELRARVEGASSLKKQHLAFWHAVAVEGEKGSSLRDAFAKAASATPIQELQSVALAICGELDGGQSMVNFMSRFEDALTPAVCLLTRTMNDADIRWVSVAIRIRDGIQNGILGPSAPPEDQQMASFWQVFGLCLSSGVPILGAMKLIAEKYVTEKSLADAILTMHDGISEGKTLTEVMGDHKDIFSADVRAAIMAGERGGVLEKSALAVGMSLRTGDMSHVTACYESIGKDPETVIEEHLGSLPIIRTVNMLLVKACDQGASLLELEAGEKQAYAYLSVARERIEIAAPMLTIYKKVTARFKSLAGLNWQDTTNVQEGVFESKIQGHLYQMRVRTEPNGTHEKVTVMFSERTE